MVQTCITVTVEFHEESAWPLPSLESRCIVFALCKSAGFRNADSAACVNVTTFCEDVLSDIKCLH